MTFTEIRDEFFDFFRSKNHKIVPSAPLINRDDPTLMFINAGMNQFKDFFLGNGQPDNPRIADTQKCLRVSGKHNDLEDVGLDAYHHTLFEMLGNWSFGDYFKEEAIAWAWEFLTEVLSIPKDRIYVTIFEGSDEDGVPFDSEAHEFWTKWVSKDRILPFDKKDNFWEMGETGPCGPCSEIHVDLRSDEERAKVNGADLVNQDDPDLIEIWNLVFIQYNRKANGDLEELPEKHIDTGMGFERLCRVLQGTKSTYDTDIFKQSFDHIQQVCGLTYTGSFDPAAKADMAMRVVADHIRAVAFTIADGELPSNTGAGYVIRRILRRAVRYYFSFLEVKEPFLHSLVPILANDFEAVFPELKAQEDFVKKVILEEERSFLRTLEAGLRRLEVMDFPNQVLDGQTAFELYDTFGFPIDLTRLIVAEKGVKIDEAAFDKALAEQKKRSRDDAKREVGDWHQLSDNPKVDFVGYDQLSVFPTQVVKYRTIMVQDKPQYQIVLSQTPFYPEGGGQVGDQGVLHFDNELIRVFDTKKENDLIVHFVEALPQHPDRPVRAVVDAQKRKSTTNNHSATHLVHAALRKVLGNHVQQKGSLVNDSYLRFDFSHFQKMTKEEIIQVENMVNKHIRANIACNEQRHLPLAEAEQAGAMMLFGEKYGETVRMITFDQDYSIELCGGTHVQATGQIGLFKISSESAIAAGVRRIEAVTGALAIQFVNQQLKELEEVRGLFKNPSNLVGKVQQLIQENKDTQKKMEQLVMKNSQGMAKEIVQKVESINGVNVLAQTIDLKDPKAIKTLVFELERSIEKAVVCLAADINGKPLLTIAINKELVAEKGLHAGNLVREMAKAIKGGGGGQPFFATAGGSDVSGIADALALLKESIN